MGPGGAATERRRRIKFRVGTRLVELADRVAARPPLRLKRLGEDHDQIALELAGSNPRKVIISRLRRTQIEAKTNEQAPNDCRGSHGP